MQSGKLLILIGILLVLAGIFITAGGKISWLGRLPGDIRITRENFSFYFPLGTCLLVSLLISLLLWLLRR